MKILNICNLGREIFLFLRNEKGELEIKKDESFFPYFYELHPEGNFTTFDNKTVKKIFASDPWDVQKRRSTRAYEADIIFTRRYIIDKINNIEKTIIKYAFIDIEVKADELPDVTKAEYPVSCISIYNSIDKKVTTFYLPDYETEFQMIEDFIAYMNKEQFDIWFSWNVRFDYNYLYNRFPDFHKKIGYQGMKRYGNTEVYYPVGISIIDYLEWFKKITLNKKKDYSLDAIAQEELDEKPWGKSNFGIINEEIKKKNINDVLRMAKLEDKYKVIPYFDEIRRLSKVDWEDLIWNSRVIDMLLLSEAKKQNIILPMKPVDNEKEEYEGAYREAYKLGAHFGISKYDLSSAYPYAIIDFCLDPTNIVSKMMTAVEKPATIGIETVSEKEEIKHILPQTKKIDPDNCLQEYVPQEITFFMQNKGALLPTVVQQLIEIKKKIGKEKDNTSVDANNYKDIKIKYDAIKTIVNSAYGVMGNRFFRLYDKRVAAATTFLVRDVLHFVRDKIEEKGYKVIYVDTDGVFINTEENLTDVLNNFVKQWAKEKFNKEDINTEFGYEGVFEGLLILAKCLDGRSKVKTENGYKRINWIYRNNYKGKVYSLDNKGKLILSKIKEVYKNSLNNRKLYKVILLHNNETLKKPKGAILTEDHKILTNKGWKQIKNLSRKDKIHSGTFMPDKDIYEALLGTLLGDSSITKAGMLSCSHSSKQKKYFNFKAKLFKCENRTKKYKIQDYKAYKFTSLVFPYLRELRRLFYPYDKKIINKQIVKNYSLISLAFHFMDDGYLRQTKYFSSELATCAYTKKEIKLLSKKIKQLGIKNSITKNHRIYFTVKQTKILSKLIAPYVYNSMNYKLLPEDRNINKYNFSFNEIAFYDTHKLIKYQSKYPSVYDLEIEKSHNFMTLSGIVHNCRYKGYLRKPNEELEDETKGIEAKRKDSTTFMKIFQTTLIDKIIKYKESREHIINWTKEQILLVQKQTLPDISFPCKLGKKPGKYKNMPIFLRALNNTSNYNKRVGEKFYWLYVKPIEEPKRETHIYVDNEIYEIIKKDTSRKEVLLAYAEQNIDKSRIKVLHVKDKPSNVQAFDEENFSHIDRNQVDWDLMRKRNILNKIEVIFEAMEWDIKEIESSKKDIIMYPPEVKNSKLNTESAEKTEEV